MQGTSERRILVGENITVMVNARAGKPILELGHKSSRAMNPLDPSLLGQRLEGIVDGAKARVPSGRQFARRWQLAAANQSLLHNLVAQFIGNPAVVRTLQGAYRLDGAFHGQRRMWIF